MPAARGTSSVPRLARTWNSTTAAELRISATEISQRGAAVCSTTHSGTPTFSTA
ncbi:MAG: hypothetical protein ACRDT4_02895 [Micromonosporaceae bacterium]